MKELKIIDVVPSRFETTGKRLIAGMSDRYTFETNEGIPALWQAFIPYIGTLPGRRRDLRRAATPIRMAASNTSPAWK